MRGLFGELGVGWVGGEERKSARGERSEREEKERERWGLHPLRRLVTPFESVRLLPPGGYSQVGEGGKRKEVGVGKC